jgi:predicted transcriptional regulator
MCLASYVLDREALLKELRGRNLTLSDFARKAGMPPGTMSYAAQGKPIGTKVYRKIYDAPAATPVLKAGVVPTVEPAPKARQHAQCG